MTLFTRVIWVVRMGKMLLLYKPSNKGPEAENKINIFPHFIAGGGWVTSSVENSTH